MKSQFFTIKFHIVIGLLAYLSIATFLPKANADGLSLAIYPPITKIQMLAPNVIDSDIKVQNLSDNPVDLKILIKPFTSSGAEDGTIAYLENESQSQSIKSFITENVKILDNNDNTLQEINLTPKQVKPLRLHVEVAKDIPPSDYYFSIVFVSNQSIGDSVNESALSGGIATNVLVSIGNPQKPTALIDRFSTNSLITSGPVHFLVKVANDNNFFIQPQGRILIKNMFGQTVGKVTLLPVTILSHTARYMPDDSGKSLTESVWPETFLMGPYTATLSIALSDKGPLYERSIHFFAAPWQLIVGIIIIIIVVVIIFVRVRQRLKTMYG